MYVTIQKLALKDCRCPGSLRCAASHTRKAESVVRQDGCRGAKCQNCLSEYLYNIQTCRLFEYAIYCDASRGVVQVRDQVQIPHAKILHGVPVRASHGIRVLPLKPYPSAFFCLCGARLYQPVFSHYAVYGTAAYVFVRQCLGDLSHP